MDALLEIGFHNLDSSKALEARIRGRVARLGRRFGRLVGCRVAVEAPHRQHRKGNVYAVHLEVSVPGGAVQVSHVPHHPREHYRRIDFHAIVDDAFDIAERRLEELKTRRTDRRRQVPEVGEASREAGDAYWMP
ncbi:MAG: HPF/RaiA family ribosome-associated protein [Alphaproteobacteria bacterium]